MNKKIKIYAACWAVLLALFNVICFVTPDSASGMNKFGGAFWAGYIFITVAFIGQLACAYVALKAENAQKLFYRLPLITASYSGLVLTMIAGALCMVIPDLPNWAGIIVCAVILAFNVLALIKASAAATAVSAADDKIKAKTYFIKSITAEAEVLLSAAKNKADKDLCEKAYEAIRYSDPTSVCELAVTEQKIAEKFEEFKKAITSDNGANVAPAGKPAAELCDELLLLIKERNVKCKALK